MALDKKAYDKDYIMSNLKMKSLSFNTKNEDDMELLNWLEIQPEKVTPYIKRLIREDMEKRGMKP